MLSQNVLAHDIACLLNGKCLDATILIVCDFWLQDVDAAGIEPFGAPVSEVEIGSH